MHPSNMGSSHKVSSKHRVEIVALGDKALADSTTVIEIMIGTLQEIIESENRKLERVRQRQADGTGDPRGDPGRPAGRGQREGQLDRFHTRATKFMTTPNKRCIGQVLRADPFGVSDEPDGSTID